MVFLYSGGIVGYKFFMFRINSNNEGKEWDFPFANRIVAIIVMLVLSFLHYPVGEKEVISVDNGKIDIQMETSGAKVAIGFLANIGATIADVASGAGITVYMDYLLKATNMQGYEDVVKSVQSQQRPIIEFAVSQSFFNTACSNGQHKKQYNSLGSFASAKGHLDNLWSIEKWDINNQFFGGTGGVISPLLCQKIEKNMKIDESVLNGMKSANDKMLSNLGSTGILMKNGADYKNMADVYVDMQLIATRDLGWIMSATLPISHIYMLNAGTINNTFDGLNRSTNGETTTIMLKSMVKAESQADSASNETMQYIDDADSDTLGSGVFRWATNDMIGRQVYNMLPMFSELRGTIQVLTNGAIDSVIEIAGLIIPAGKVFSAVNSLKSKITLKAKNNDLKNGMSHKDANDLAKQRADSVVSGVQAYAVYLISYYIAIYLYKILLGAIFASVVTLLAILKIGLYFWDCFIHIFVSPLLVLWKMTIQDRTEKVNAWIVDGFILYVIKPTILVFSFFMFIISFEILQGLYGLMFDLAFSVLKLNHTMFEEGSIMLSVIVEGAMRGFSDVFIYFIGMVLAYFTILKGDTMILDKFKYKDDTDTGVVNQLGERIQALGGSKNLILALIMKMKKRYKTNYANVYYRIRKNREKSYVVVLSNGKELTVKPTDEYPVITEKIAQKIKFKLDEEAKKGGKTEKASNITFEQFFDTYVKLNQLSEVTADTNLRICRNHIFPHIGKIKLSKLNQLIINNLSNYLSNLNLKNVTRKHYINVLVAIINCAKKCKLIPYGEIETKFINRPKIRSEEEVRERYMSEEEMKIFLNDEEMKNNEFIYLFFILMCYTAARGITIRKIKPKDINIAENTITLEDTKNGGYYTIPLEEKVIQIVLKYVKNNEIKPDEYIFNPEKKSEENYLHHRNWHRIQVSVYKKIKKIANKHGMKTNGLGLHAVRKGFAVILFQKNIQSKIISKYLNHSDEKTTSKHYTIINDRMLQDNRIELSLL